MKHRHGWRLRSLDLPLLCRCRMVLEKGLAWLSKVFRSKSDGPLSILHLICILR